MILTMMALFSMTLTFAENESTDNLNTIEAYDMSVNMTRLGVVLGLSNDQMEGVAVVHKTFCAEMMFAAHYGKEERSKMVDNAIKKDLAYMNYILNREQYRKYLTLLNVTLRNHGLK